MRRDAAPIRHISIPYLRINILCADFLQPRLPYQCMSSLSGRKRRITLRPFGPLLETSTDSPAAVFTPLPIFRRAPARAYSIYRATHRNSDSSRRERGVRRRPFPARFLPRPGRLSISRCAVTQIAITARIITACRRSRMNHAHTDIPAHITVRVKALLPEVISPA